MSASLTRAQIVAAIDHELAHCVQELQNHTVLQAEAWYRVAHRHTFEELDQLVVKCFDVVFGNINITWGYDAAEELRNIDTVDLSLNASKRWPLSMSWRTSKKYNIRLTTKTKQNSSTPVNGFNLATVKLYFDTATQRWTVIITSGTQNIDYYPLAEVKYKYEKKIDISKFLITNSAAPPIYDGIRTCIDKYNEYHDARYQVKFRSDVSSQAQQTETKVFMVSLDQCACYGTDTDGLLFAAQHFNASEDNKLELMTALLNPSMLNTFKKNIDADTRLVIYIEDGPLFNTLLDAGGIPFCFLKDAGGKQPYTRGVSCLTEAYVSSRISTEQFFDLCDYGLDDTIQKQLKRIFLAREAIQRALKLESPPELVLSGHKRDVSIDERNVKRICQMCLDPPGNSSKICLWYSKLLYDSQHSGLPVPKFKAVPSATATQINDIFKKIVPGLLLHPPKDGHLIRVLRGMSETSSEVHGIDLEINDKTCPDWLNPSYR